MRAGVAQVRATDGDTRLGGEDIDARLVNHFLEVGRGFRSAVGWLAGCGRGSDPGCDVWLCCLALIPGPGAGAHHCQPEILVRVWRVAWSRLIKRKGPKEQRNKQECALAKKLKMRTAGPLIIRRGRSGV